MPVVWDFFNLDLYFFQNQPQDNVQAVEDSGEGDGSGEQTDITAGQSESTDGNEERGVGRAEAADNEGHHGESSAVQASADASQQVRDTGFANLVILTCHSHAQDINSPS